MNLSDKNYSHLKMLVENTLHFIQNNERVYYTFRTYKHEESIGKQPNTALKSIVDTPCFIIKYGSVP